MSWVGVGGCDAGEKYCTGEVVPVLLGVTTVFCNFRGGVGRGVKSSGVCVGGETGNCFLLLATTSEKSLVG